MNLYPIYGHLGFKCFIGVCAYAAACFAKQAENDRERIATALERINNTLDRNRNNSKYP